MKIGGPSSAVKRTLVIGAAVIAVSGIGFTWMQRTGKDDGLLRLYGNVDIREVQLAFRQPGRIAQMAFDEGDAVSAGTRLAALDAQPYREALAAAEATAQVAQTELAKLRRGLRPQEITQARQALKQAQAAAVDTERNYQRQSGLLASGASSQRTVDVARTARDQAAAGAEAAKAALSQAFEGFRKEDIAAAEARLAAARAAQAQAATALADTELLAPSDGTVIARVREPGSMVASQSTVYSLSLDKPVYVRGYVVIPQDFEQRLALRGSEPLVQVITDGSHPNTANYVENYAKGVVQNWRAGLEVAAPVQTVVLEPRYWFNPELESRRALIPGAIAIVMTIIGTMLTALVVSREWERGTMEAVLSTPASVAEILIGKLLPYFVLGMLSTLGAAALAVFVFDVPLRGSLAALLLLSAVFMVPALGQGLLISSLARNQFLAAQIALFTGFLPAFMLSGFLYEIDAMPAPIRAVTTLVPARHFVESLKTVFLAGDIWPVFARNLLAMAAVGMVFFVLAKRATRKNLE